MKIGIDFDNTIAIYDDLFNLENKKYNFTGNKKSNPKETLKKNLLKSKNGLFLWNKFQGSLYGGKIKYAKIASGLKLFLIIAQYFKYEIFIISHKTEYGHYDKNKINLRTEALKWLRQNNFFVKKNLLIKKKNIFFCNSQEDKIQKINSLNLDYFVDDLPVILKHKEIKYNIKKIFYNRFDSKIKDKNIQKFSNWADISNFIFNLDENKIKKILCSNLISKKIKSFKKINIYGNSNVYKIIDVSNNKFIAKFFPNKHQNDRKRIENEIKAIDFLKNKFHIPKIINYFLDENLIVYKHINGKKLKSNQIIEFINVVKRLKKLSKNLKYNTFLPATEACLNSKQIFDQIEERKKLLIF